MKRDEGIRLSGYQVIRRRGRSLCLCAMVALCLLFFSSSAQATTYYVDANNGNDNNSGTSALPWKTIQRAERDNSSYNPSVKGGDTVYIAGGNYGFWNWNKVYNSISSSWTTYKAVDSKNPPVFSRLHIYSCNSFGDVDNVVRDGYLVFDGLKFEMTGLSQDELNTPFAFYSKYLSHIKVRNCNFEAGMNWRLADNIIVGQCVNIRGNEGKHFAYDIEVSDCTMTNSQDGIIFYMVNGGLITRNTVYHLANDAMQAADAMNTTISNNTLYDLDVLGDKTNVDGNNTLANGPFHVGELVTQTHPEVTNTQKDVGHLVPAGIYTATIKAIFNNYYYVDVTDKGVYGGGFVPGYLITGTTSGATITPTEGGVDGYHSNSLQIYSSEAGTTDNITVSGNKFYGGYESFRFQGDYPCDGLLVENNLWYGKFYVPPCVIVGKTHSAAIRNNTFAQSPLSRVADTELHSTEPGAVYEIHNNIFSRYLYIEFGPDNGYVQAVHESHNIISSIGFTGAGAPSIDTTDYEYHHNVYPLTTSEMNTIFEDPTNNNFQLKAGSKAIDFGLAAYAPATDILGNQRDASPDAGCYEYGASSVIYGDLSGDGQISAYDAALTARIAVGLDPLGDKLQVADVSGDGQVTAYDAALIAQKAVGLINKFPVEN